MQMLYSELEAGSLEELIAAFRGPPLDGEEYRASFFDDVADEIARRGGIAFLEGALDQEDEDRMAAAFAALASCEHGAVDRRGLTVRLRRLLEHSSPAVVATAIEGLRQLDDRTVHDRVRGLLDHGPPSLVRAHALIYLSVLFADSALPLLLAALHDPDAAIRLTAVDQLDDLDRFEDRTVFERALEDPDVDVREHARYILDHHYASG